MPLRVIILSNVILSATLYIHYIAYNTIILYILYHIQHYIYIYIYMRLKTDHLQSSIQMTFGFSKSIVRQNYNQSMSPVLWEKNSSA